MKKEIYIYIKVKNHKKYNNNDNRNKLKITKGKTISYEQHTSKPDDTHFISARQQLNLLQKILCREFIESKKQRWRGRGC